MRQSMFSSEHRGVPEMSYPVKVACSVGDSGEVPDLRPGGGLPFGLR